MLTTEQALERLKKEGITENIQMVRRWIRNGELPANAPAKRKDGYLISESDLAAFIERKRKKPKRTAAEYEAEINQLRAELERVQAENDRLREELGRSEERNSVLTRDLFNALDKQEKDQQVNWKRKYDQLLKQGQEKSHKLHQAQQEIEILRMKLANPEAYSPQELPTQNKPQPRPTSGEPGEFTERFIFQKQKYEVKVYVRNGKYEIELYNGWGSQQKELAINKTSPLFMRFLAIVREKHGISVEMSLASWQQLVPVD